MKIQDFQIKTKQIRGKGQFGEVIPVKNIMLILILMIVFTNAGYLNIGYADVSWEDLGVFYKGDTYNFDQTNYVYRVQDTASGPTVTMDDYGWVRGIGFQGSGWVYVTKSGSQTMTRYGQGVRLQRVKVRDSNWENVGIFNNGDTYTFDQSRYLYRAALNESYSVIWEPGYTIGWNKFIIGGAHGWTQITLDGSVMLKYDNIVLQRKALNTAPNVTINSPIENKYYTQNDNSITPSIIVSDEENANLICKYYIDSETAEREVKTVTNTSTAKTVNFSPINISSLSEGNHAMRFEVNDGLEAITLVVKFIVDKPPILGSVNVSSSTTEITVTGSATDSFLGLNVTPYRYTVGSNISAWLTNASYTQRYLTPNTAYTVKFEARDTMGNIASRTQFVYTKAEIPRINIENPTSYTLDIKISDNNPMNTVYQIINTANNKYLTPFGEETSIPTWIQPNNRMLTARNLVPQTAYSYKVQAKNEVGAVSGFSSPATGTTLATPPPKVGELTATADMNSITIYWPLVDYATSYEIEGDGVILGSVQGTSFTHTGLITNTEHTYRVRGKNGTVAGPWSDPISKSTLPPIPVAPTNINSLATRNTITVTWNSVNGATAYDIEVDGNIISNGNSTNYVHSGLIPNTNHTYRIRSINPAGKSGWSDMITVITQDQELPVPQNIVVEPYKTKVRMVWDMIPGLTYQLEVDGNLKSLGSVSEYIHDNLLPDTEHSYRVRSVKDGSYSDWSRLIVVRTKADIFTVPTNVQGDADDTKITVSWEAVTDADGYDIDVDGTIIDNGNNTSFVHEGLDPGSSHTYKVRARNGSDVSQWSEPITVATYTLPKPGNITTTATETEITVSWSSVMGAESYEMKVDGNSIKNITGTTYTITGLLKGTQHTISIRAVNTQGTSGFSTPLIVLTAGEGSKIPQNIGAITTKDQIALIWEEINGADGYEVRVGEQIFTEITNNTYVHKDLTPDTAYTYMVRITTAEGSGQWSEAMTIKTMSQAPGIPGNLSAVASTSTILLTWDSVTDAEEYELKIGNDIISTGVSAKYLHTGLVPNTEYTYAVRSKNNTDVSPWSEPITAVTNSSSQEFRVSGAIGEERDLVITASNIASFQGYVFTLMYNPDEVELVDLSSLTAKMDVTTGNIVGTDIEIIQNQPGILQFKKLTSIPQGQAYSGVINSARFKLKTANEVVITYTTN
ncbi:MAG: fibronectin type III domain-containing protein [Bacillota bacterium]